ncbi:DUF6289 family protein [Dyella choica]|uniref:Uncharacterized protein n=1 Tax=Dyella choica TaxID=1927959 RepID=A0A432M9R9_9GAMM|nr:DUF6289 family protein [Dyella choica]RUL78363.1 hypothetical protein EKH80_05935 [Dyella choica]
MKFFSFRVLLGLIVFLGVAANAWAVRPYALAYTYFDASGRIVGAQTAYCDGSAYHGGTLNTAYYIYASTPCTLPCQPGGYDGGSCGGPYTPPSQSIVPGTGVVNYALPGAETIQQACQVAQCLGGSVMPNNWNYGFPWYPGFQ